MLDEFERSSCRCRQCIDTCKTIPGILAPGDLDRIAAYVGADPEGQFLYDNFVVGEDLAQQFGNESLNVPVIAPAQHPSGRCVFLTHDDRCSIEPVKPFGCSRCNACQGGNRPAISACLEAIANDMPYLETWTTLANPDAVT